jgi:hypothetical protein
MNIERGRALVSYFKGLHQHFREFGEVSQTKMLRDESRMIIRFLKLLTLARRAMRSV